MTLNDAKDGVPDPQRPKAARKRSKLAAVIARRIEDRIIERGWTVGQPLGHEAELAAEAGVSRWTFREAIALLEHSGLVESRRGNGGGLFVASPLRETVCNALSNYIIFVRAPSTELAGILRAAERVMITRCAAGLDEATRPGLDEAVARCDNANLSEALEASAAIRPLLIEQTGNPALSLASGMIAATIMQASWYSTFDDAGFYARFERIVAATRDMAKALGAGRVQDAMTASETYVSTCEEILAASSLSGRLPSRARAAERAYSLYPAGRAAKKSEYVARAIREAVIDAGWPIGMDLGTQAELMERFGVGRPVLREALRSLERLGVIEIGRGASSGVRTISPSPVELIESARRYLRLERMTRADAQELFASMTQEIQGAGAGRTGPEALLPLLADIFRDAD